MRQSSSTGMRSATTTPLSALLLSAVHPVTLYSQAPPHCKQRACASHSTHCALTQRTQRRSGEASCSMRERHEHVVAQWLTMRGVTRRPSSRIPPRSRETTRRGADATNGDDGSYGEVTMCVIKKEARTPHGSPSENPSRRSQRVLGAPQGRARVTCGSTQHAPSVKHNLGASVASHGPNPIDQLPRL